MEIRPYRTQVRATPTPEPANRQIDTSKAQAYKAFGDMITHSGQAASSALHQWNNAMEQRRAQDRKIAYQAGVQEMDVLFAELGKAINDDMTQREQDPFSVFDADTKTALNEIYSYHVNQIKDKTVGRAADQDTKAMLELYFRSKKLEAGASVEQAIKAHTDNVAATVMGKANAGLVEAAIAGNAKDIATSMEGIKQNLGILAERGVLTKAQIDDNLAAAKEQIEFGRAKNQIDALDYKTGQEFINKISVKDETRSALQDYFKDKWERQKNIWEQEAGAAFEQGLDMYMNGTLDREWIYSQPAFTLHPEVGLNKDFRKDLVALLDDNEDKDAREAANRKYRVMIDKGDNIDKVWQDILYDPDLKASDVDTLGNLISKKRGGKGTGTGSGSGSSAVASVGFSTLYDAVSNPYMSDTVRLLKIAQWKADHPEEANNPDVNKLYNEARQGHLVTHPRIVTLDKDLETTVNDLYKAGKDDQAKAIDTLRYSVLHTIAVDMWYTEDAKGNKIPVPETKRQEMLNDAINRLEQAKAMSDLTDPFNYHYTDDPAKIEVIGDKYDYNIKFREGGYKKVKQNVFSAHLLQDIENISRDIKEMQKSEGKALADMGINLDGYEYKFFYLKGRGGNMYFYNPDKDDAYYLDYNSKGKLNAYHLPPGLADDPDVVTPPSVKEVVDTKKSLKEARKEEAKKWAAEMDELTEM